MNVNQISNLLGNYRADFVSGPENNYQKYAAAAQTLTNRLDKLRERKAQEEALAKEQARYEQAQAEKEAALAQEQARYEQAQAEKEAALAQEQARYEAAQARQDRAEQIAAQNREEDNARKDMEFEWRKSEAEANRDLAKGQIQAQKDKELAQHKNAVSTTVKTINLKDSSTWTLDDAAKIEQLMQESLTLGNEQEATDLENLYKRVAGQVAVNQKKAAEQAAKNMRWQNYQQGQTIKNNKKKDAEDAEAAAADSFLTGLKK